MLRAPESLRVMTKEDWKNAARMLMVFPLVVVMVLTMLVYAGFLFIGWAIYRFLSWRPNKP